MAEVPKYIPKSVLNYDVCYQFLIMHSCRKNPDLFDELAKGQSPKVSISDAYAILYCACAIQ